jgi:hypothetical protein
MPSSYERNEQVPRVRIPHYAAKTPQPHLDAPADPTLPKPEIDVSYDELIITAAVDLDEAEGRDSEAS